MNLDRHSPEDALIESGLDFPVPGDAICFGSFVLIPQHHQLLKNGEPVPLGSRAMLLLIAMASRPGELLEKSELLTQVWPKVVVEECNLRAQILSLRRVLSEDSDFDCIVTVPGRGYRFVAPVSTPVSVARSPAVQAHGMPQGAMRQVFGRDSLLNILELQLQRCRFITLTGHAGTGKTTVALALGNRMLAQYPEGVRFIDLAPVSRGHLVHAVIADALGIDSTLEDPLNVIATHLANSKALLILDNCEHVLEETATAIETILRNAPRCSVLVTSREALHAEGEFVHDLSPLAFPPAKAVLNTQQARTYPAVQLLVERITAHDLGYVFTDSDVKAAPDICRKLDGNALAIEIAAARVRAFGIDQLVEMLDGSFRLQMTGRRTALPRHRSLSAALDWTYAMLSADEQLMLRQLSVFRGPFMLHSVKAVTDVASQNQAQLLESLMDKSLVIACQQGSITRYRLLETTRLYAARKLAEHAETDTVAQRHARWTVVELKESVQALNKTTPQAWIEQYAEEIDSVRTALDWAYSPVGEPGLAVELTLLSVPLWLRLSLTGECYDWVNRGLQSTSEFTRVEQRQRMLLLTVSASVMTLTFGGGTKIRQSWEQVSQDALALDDVEHQLRALWGMWNDQTCCNQYVAALDLAERYVALSKSAQRSERQLLGLRMRANALFHQGQLDRARTAVIEALSSPLSANSHIIDLHFDQRIAARSLKAQIQWLQGEVGPALLSLEENVNQAIILNHPATLWYTLCLSAIPTTLIAGQLHKARHYLSLLQASVEGHDLYLWRQFTRCFEYILMIRQGRAEEGVPALGEVIEQLRDQGDTPLRSLIRSEYSLGLITLGLGHRALEVIDETLCVARSREDRWFLPELLRIKAQILIEQGARAVTAPRDVLSEAMSEASRQGAHFWSARIAGDLLRLQSMDLPQADLA